MYVWEAKLANSRNAWEFKASNYRRRWWATSNNRDGLIPGTDSYGWLTERLQDLERMIDDCLEAIKQIDGIFNCGPIVGGEIALVVRRTVEGRKLDVPQTRSIITIIQERAEDYRNGIYPADSGVVSEEEAFLIAQGLDDAAAILIAPYNYLSDEERIQWDKVSKDMAEKIPEEPIRKTSVDLARDILAEIKEADVVERAPRKKKEKAPELPDVASLEAELGDDEDVVVRRR